LWYIALFQVESGYIIIIKKFNDILENIETVFKGQFTNGNYTIPCQNTIFFKENVWFYPWLQICPKKTLIFRKQLKVRNLIPYPYPARIFE